MGPERCKLRWFFSCNCLCAGGDAGGGGGGPAGGSEGGQGKSDGDGGVIDAEYTDKK